MDINNILKNLIRVGRISEVNPAANTARVTYPDKNDSVSGELNILNRGSSKDKDYWVPDVDEQVVCLFLPNTHKGVNRGFVLGSFFSTTDTAPQNDKNIRTIKFADGSVITHDRSDGSITIHASGNITITAGGTITIQGATVKIN